MDNNEFLRQQQAAVERMREMNSRASSYKNVEHQMPPVPPFVNLNNTKSHRVATPNAATPKKEAQAKPSTPNYPLATMPKPQQNGFGIPFLDSIIKDSDSTLIIGLLLLLMSENCDKMLLFALIYILM